MTTLRDLPQVKTWLVEPVGREVDASLVRLANAPDVVRMAVMPDVHLSHDVCVGVALATKQLIYPAAVGGDIGCGMLAMRFLADASDLEHEAAAARLLAGLYRRVPSLKHPTSTSEPGLPDELQRAPLSHSSLEKLKGRDARLQLGTLGRGNHFIEFQSDADDQLWILIHSGSRGVGQAITAHHLRFADWHGESKLAAFDADSAAGQAYLADHDWAQNYAAWNRLTMLESIIDLVRELFRIDADRNSLIHTDHNHVRQETHDGTRLWVHRKGAQSALEGEPGIIPGSMGTATYHVEGRGNSVALCSSSHGAGRVLSRTAAALCIPINQLRREVQHVWVDERRMMSLRDEAPSAYRDIRQVVKAQHDLVKVVRTLQPLLNYKR